MIKYLLLAGIAAAFLAFPAQAESLQELCVEHGVTGCEHTKDTDTDTNTDTTKELNGRVGEAASLAAAADTRIGKTGERLNLDLNAVTHDFGGSSVGGGVFVHVPELADGLYIGARGAYNTAGGGGLVGVGVSYSFSPF